MKRVVQRERNKTYYRVLHLPLWIWVFFVLPGHLTFALFNHGPDQRHLIWLSFVAAVCVWRGFAGRLPGVEHKPYITHFGVHQPNLPYRVVCYTGAWIALLVPFTLNLVGMVIAIVSGRWIMGNLYEWLYYPLALSIVIAMFLDLVPRAKRSTANEGAERAWFYLAVWTIVPTQLANWAMWRLGSHFDLSEGELAAARLLTCVIVGGVFATLSYRGRLPRTERYLASQEVAASIGA